MIGFDDQRPGIGEMIPANGQAVAIDERSLINERLRQAGGLVARLKEREDEQKVAALARFKDLAVRMADKKEAGEAEEAVSDEEAEEAESILQASGKTTADLLAEKLRILEDREHAKKIVNLEELMAERTARGEELRALEAKRDAAHTEWKAGCAAYNHAIAQLDSRSHDSAQAKAALYRRCRDQGLLKEFQAATNRVASLNQQLAGLRERLGLGRGQGVTGQITILRRDIAGANDSTNQRALENWKAQLAAFEREAPQLEQQIADLEIELAEAKRQRHAVELTMITPA